MTSADGNNYVTEANLAKRQSLFDFVETSEGTPALERVEWSTKDRVLDVGCGNGLWLRRLLDEFEVGTLFGVDLSPGMVGAARATAGSEAQLVVTDAQCLPFADYSLDKVVALWMLYHVPDKRAALNEIRRVLRPGGLLLVTTNSNQRTASDAVLERALSSVLGRAIPRCLPELSFSAENGQAILEKVFPEVVLERTVVRLAVPTAEPVIEAMLSTRGPMEQYLEASPDWDAVSDLARQEVEAAIESDGVFRTEMVGASFVCR